MISNFADAKHYRGQYRPAVHSRFLHVSTASPTPHYALVGLILRRYFAVFRAEKCDLKTYLSDKNRLQIKLINKVF